MRALACLVALAACGGHAGVSSTPAHPLAASSPQLPPPPPIAATARGAAYLTVIAAHIQPAWAQFLEDCRLRLPAGHPLNQPALGLVVELAIARDGQVEVHVVTGSGNGDFDTAASDVIGDATPLPTPPPELASDDERVHVRWLFARDGRQAGPATAQVVTVELPLLGAVDRLLARDALDRAAQRVAAAPAGAPDRLAAAERVMIAVLREGLASSSGAVRRAAVEAIGRANIQSLAAELRHHVTPSAVDSDLRLVAMAAVASLGDPASVPLLAADLRDDLAHHPRLGLAKVTALVALHHAADAAPAIRAELDTGPSPTALAALRLVPDLALAPKLTAWFASTDARTRVAVCTALPDAAPALAPSLITRGLKDADAAVRASCVEAFARGARAGQGASPREIARLHELAKDRDQRVRARAIAVINSFDPAHRARALDDPAPEVRAASATAASESELRTLATDRDPDVRAAAYAALGEHAGDLAAAAVNDTSAQVRKAAIVALASDDVLERLASDPSPEVATAALVKLGARRGRAALTSPFLKTVAGAPPGGPERVRLALAWLLAP
jgi:hypothetical protein